MMNALLFEHSVPLVLLLAALGVAWAATLFAVLRWPGFSPLQTLLVAVRLLFFLLLGWCLLLPSRKEDEQELRKPHVLVALDVSASMTNSPSADVPPRHVTARLLLTQEWVRVVSAQSRFQIHPFDLELLPPVSPPEAVTLPSRGSGTALRQALSRLVERYRGQDVAALLLLSDGLDTRERSALWTRQPWPFPIYTVRLEPPVPWRANPEVRVDGVDTPRRVTVGWSSELKASLSGEGTRGEVIHVRLLRDGVLVQELPTQLPDEGGSREVVFPLQHESVGLFTYEVHVPPLVGEQQTNDNQYAVTVHVMDARQQLLYVEGLPRWESKYLMRVLRSLSDLTPLAFLRGPDGRFLSYGLRGGTTLDLTEAQLAAFQIVILGDFEAAELGTGRDTALVRFVENGGSLILLGGPKSWGPGGWSATALDRLLPIRRPGAAIEGRFPVLATREGLAHPAFAGHSDWLARLPPVLSLFPGGQPTPAATVLIEARTDTGLQPLVAFQRFGQGKVVAVLTDSLWRWQLDSEDRADSYHRFWSQLLNWLLPKETEAAPYQLDLFSDVEQIHLGEPIQLRGRFTTTRTTEDPAPETIPCELQTPEGRRIPYVMMRDAVTGEGSRRYTAYSLRFQPESPGLHRAIARVTVQGVLLESSPYSFFVKPYTPESMPRPPDEAVLRALAAASGGRYLEPVEVSAAMTRLDLKPREERLVRVSTLWNTIPLLACLMALLVVEWTIRKWKGLV